MASDRTDEILERMSPLFDAMYAAGGRPSIPPEKLLRAQLLQMLYSVRSERLPSFHVGGAIRFDPQEVAKWLRSKYGVIPAEGKKPPSQVQIANTQENRMA